MISNGIKLSVQNIAKILRPTRREMAVYVVFCLFVVLWSTLASAYPGLVSHDFVKETALIFKNMALYITSLAVFSSIASFLLWGLVGIVLYLVAWTLIVAYVDTKNDLVIGEMFVHPDSFHKKDYWVSVLGRKLCVVFGIVAVPLFLFGLLITIPNLATALDFYGSTRAWNISYLAQQIAFIAAWFTCLHLLVVSRRIYILKIS